MFSVLDSIIELENEFVKKQKRIPRKLKLSNVLYLRLIKELEKSRLTTELHGMQITITVDNKIELE